MHRHILLTCATGELGPALAAELARAKAAERIAVLMRCAPGDLGARFGQWLDAVRLLMTPEEYVGLERLYPVAGDICQEKLGLGGAEESLARETDVVIHAAADTNFSAPPE